MRRSRFAIALLLLLSIVGGGVAFATDLTPSFLSGVGIAPTGNGGDQIWTSRAGVQGWQDAGFGSGGGGISQLTGQVLAGPGSGSQAASIPMPVTCVVGETACGLSQTTESTATKGADSKITPQKSTHATDHGGGNLIIDLDTPAGDGVESFVDVTRTGSSIWRVGYSSGSNVHMWMNSSAPSTTNHILFSDTLDVQLNANGGGVAALAYGGTSVFSCGSSACTELSTFNTELAGAADFGGGVGVLGLQVANTSPTALGSTGVVLYGSTTGQFLGVDAKGITFPSGIVGPVIQQDSINSAGTGVNTTLQAQSNLGSGSGGSIIVASGTGTAAPGVINLNSGSTTVIALGGTNGVGLGAQNVAVTMATSGITTLTAAQATLPVLTINTVTFSGAATLTFPNVSGVWWVDISRCTLTNAITFKSGSGTCGTVSSLTTNDNVIEVLAEGSNTCLINL